MNDYPYLIGVELDNCTLVAGQPTSTVTTEMAGPGEVQDVTVAAGVFTINIDPRPHAPGFGPSNPGPLASLGTAAPLVTMPTLPLVTGEAVGGPTYEAVIVTTSPHTTCHNSVSAADDRCDLFDGKQELCDRPVYDTDVFTGSVMCCVCGGGTSTAPTGSVCVDFEGWADSGGDTCGIYASAQYCDLDGTAGPGWDIDWGVLAGYADADGIQATTACCSCGGGSANPVVWHANLANPTANPTAGPTTVLPAAPSTTSPPTSAPAQVAAAEQPDPVSAPPPTWALVVFVVAAVITVPLTIVIIKVWFCRNPTAGTHSTGAEATNAQIELLELGDSEGQQAWQQAAAPPASFAGFLPDDSQYEEGDAAEIVAAFRRSISVQQCGQVPAHPAAEWQRVGAWPQGNWLSAGTVPAMPDQQLLYPGGVDSSAL